MAHLCDRSHLCRCRKSGLADLGTFIGAVLDTMRNWRDLLQGRAPGHRDRIVRIGLSAEEGGLNLDMPQQVLTSIAGKGADAARLILDEFSFDNHFWVRYRNAASAIERFTISFGEGLKEPITPDNRPAFDRMWDATKYDGGPYRFTRAQAEEARLPPLYAVLYPFLGLAARELRKTATSGAVPISPDNLRRQKPSPAGVLPAQLGCGRSRRRRPGRFSLATSDPAW
jgi:hypothetical protein